MTKKLARSSRQEEAAEGRIDSRACVINMCVLGEVMFLAKLSISFNRFLSISFIQGSTLSISFNPSFKVNTANQQARFCLLLIDLGVTSETSQQHSSIISSVKKFYEITRMFVCIWNTSLLREIVLVEPNV